MQSCAISHSPPDWPLHRSGAWKYAGHADTCVLCCGYAVDNSPLLWLADHFAPSQSLRNGGSTGLLPARRAWAFGRSADADPPKGSCWASVDVNDVKAAATAPGRRSKYNLLMRSVRTGTPIFPGRFGGVRLPGGPRLMIPQSRFCAMPSAGGAVTTVGIMRALRWAGKTRPPPTVLVHTSAHCPIGRSFRPSCTRWRTPHTD